MCRRRTSAAFSLIEMMIVLALMGVLAAMVLPGFTPGVHDRLEGAVRIVQADLAYGRSLAVTNNSKYRFSFELPDNRYVLRHSGAEAALDTLPATAFASPHDTPRQRVVDLDELPSLSGKVRLAAVGTTGGTATVVGEVEFGPLGETSRVEETIVWLAAGSGDDERFVWIKVNPVTGLTTSGAVQVAGPPSTITGVAGS